MCTYRQSRKADSSFFTWHTWVPHVSLWAFESLQVKEFACEKWGDMMIGTSWGQWGLQICLPREGTMAFPFRNFLCTAFYTGSIALPHVIGLSSIDHLNMKNMNSGFGINTPGFINLLGNSLYPTSPEDIVMTTILNSPANKHLNQDSVLQQQRSK